MKTPIKKGIKAKGSKVNAAFAKPPKVLNTPQRESIKVAGSRGTAPIFAPTPG